MPNWVINKITFDKGEVDINALINEKRSFDFNKIIPMPKSLDIECGSKTDKALKYWLDNSTDKEFVELVRQKVKTIYYGKVTDTDNLEEIFALGKQLAENVRDYGAPTWCEWANKNWGTKWNANDSYVRDGCISFTTAWDCPMPIIVELSKMFPDVTFDLEYASDDGCDYGSYTFSNGEYEEHYIIDPDDFAKYLWGYEE